MAGSSCDVKCCSTYCQLLHHINITWHQNTNLFAPFNSLLFMCYEYPFNSMTGPLHFTFQTSYHMVYPYNQTPSTCRQTLALLSVQWTMLEQSTTFISYKLHCTIWLWRIIWTRNFLTPLCVYFSSEMYLITKQGSFEIRKAKSTAEMDSINVAVEYLTKLLYNIYGR